MKIVDCVPVRHVIVDRVLLGKSILKITSRPSIIQELVVLY